MNIKEFDKRVRLLSSSDDGNWLSIRNVIIVNEGGRRYLRHDHMGAVRLEDGEVFWVRVDAGELRSSFWTPDGTCYLIEDIDRFFVLELATGEFSETDWLVWARDYYSWVVVSPE